MTVPTETTDATIKEWVLNEARPLLCKNLVPDVHFPHLRSKYIINQDDIEMIQAQPITKLKVNTLIDILLQRGERGYDELLNSITRERTQKFLVDKLKNAYEEKAARLKAINEDKKQTDAKESLRLSTGPIEHCAMSPTTKPGDLPSPGNPTSPGYFVYQRISDQLTSSISDLGVDTEKLPKPVMAKKGVSEEPVIVAHNCYQAARASDVSPKTESAETVTPAIVDGGPIVQEQRADNSDQIQVEIVDLNEATA